jgi:hypothetical protein
MIRHMIGAGSTVLLLVAALSHPGMAAPIWNRTPACAWPVKTWCISAPISPNTK